MVFAVLRDATGIIQATIKKENVDEKSFKDASSSYVESSVIISGTVKKDEKQMGGYELHVKEMQMISASENFPISNKPHGVDFLMDNRHLWLRSRRQWAIMRVRNQVIFSIGF